MDELLMVTKTEAQFCITMYYLLCSLSCCQSYEFNSFRKAQLVRLRKYLNGVMIDQMPMLSKVLRYMDELLIMQSPHVTEVMQSICIVMEAVTVVQEALIKGQLGTSARSI